MRSLHLQQYESSPRYLSISLLQPRSNYYTSLATKRSFQLHLSSNINLVVTSGITDRRYVDTFVFFPGLSPLFSPGDLASNTPYPRVTTITQFTASLETQCGHPRKSVGYYRTLFPVLSSITCRRCSLGELVRADNTALDNTMEFTRQHWIFDRMNRFPFL